MRRSLPLLALLIGFALPAHAQAPGTMSDRGVLVTRGGFGVTLGLATPISLTFDRTCYLGVQVFADPGLAPGAVRFALALPKPARIELRVVDVQGRVVSTLHDRLEPGYRTPAWDGRDASGRRAGPGVSFVRLVVGDLLAGQRRIVLRDKARFGNSRRIA